MLNPFLVLGVNANADDQTIRQAYLRSLKESPPETHPEKFKAINQAYEAIKDETHRHRYQLFNKECPGSSPLDAYLHYVRLKGHPQPLSLDFFKAHFNQIDRS